MTRVEQLTAVVTEHGEGAAWSPAWPGPRWVDMLGGQVMELQPDGSIRRQRVGDVACLVRRRSRGGTLVATDCEILLSEDDDLSAPLRPWAELVVDPAVRLNEGSCAPDGSLLVGSMAYDGTAAAGELFRVLPEGTVSIAEPSVTVSNGIAWSADGTSAYYADTATGRVDRFTWSDSRGLYDRTPLVAVSSPDGLCTDDEGGVWVALYGGGAVHRYDCSGELTAVVEVPVPFVTSVAFTGHAMTDLLITTSRLESPQVPSAGALFSCTPGVRGTPLREYAG